ncbi:MAG: HAMP domain-containing protein [Herbiconiux sp.]|uniref:sensor histidine kinase n=1 Tax=Herbiconiux sp. TaxID=1871186 RepID=UPI0012043F43|nr:ATP-binding protein [Herbiconiux sp.]TAJ49853.1 MAG: HAMP domain-containing protein [Herbiconiux sp.]
MAESQRTRRAGLSIRNRLALTYTALLVCTGLAMIAAVNVTVQVMNGALIDLLYQVAIGTVLVIAALGALASWLVAGRMLRPLRRLNQVVRQVDETSLDTRLRLSGPDDEIRSLADTFDMLFAQLESAFRSRSLFAANASHELRTPLATMKTILQVALRESGDATPPHTRETFQRLLATVESMTETTTALLDLAHGGRPEVVEETDLAGIVAEEASAVSDQAEARGLTVTRALEPASVRGDPRLIRDLVVNLLRNAVTHNHDHGVIDIATGTLPDGRAQLVVQNSGDILPAERIALLTEPFYRARLRTSGGHGLGLTIVSAIADTHHAEFTLAARLPDGLTATTVFPRVSSDRSAPGRLVV